MYRILFDRCIYLLPLRASNRARIIVIAFDSLNQIDKCFLIRQTDSYAMPNANKMISSSLLFIFFFIADGTIIIIIILVVIHFCQFLLSWEFSCMHRSAA